MVSDQRRFYVYSHSHPETKEVVYIGKGTAGRAWACGYSTAKAPRGLRGNRTEEHQHWINALLERGFTPGDFVQIIEKDLDRLEALRLEKQVTERYVSLGQPLFNRMCYGTKRNAKLSQQQILQAQSLRGEGNSYARVAAHLNVSTMVAWRALNGKTKSYAKGAANGQ